MSISSPPPPAAAGGDAAASSRMRRLLQRADTYRASGQLPAAVGSLEAALALHPEYTAGWLQLAELQLALGRHNAARGATLRALQGRLDSPLTALTLIRRLNALSESALIIDVARQLPPPMWDSARSLAEMSQELSLAGINELARTFARAAVARDRNHPPSLFMQATMDVFYGDLASAADHAERCIALIPADPGSHWLLSRLRLPDGGRRVDRLERLLAAPVTAEAESWLAYALHNELHDLGEHARAWQALERGCRAKRSLLRYSQADSDRLFDQLLQWRPDEAVADGHVDPSLTPIFVIGLHRSGTTLAERIVSGHSQVTAGGETYDIRAQLRRASGLHFGGELDPVIVEQRAGFDYRAIGQNYVAGMRWRAAGARFVTDKLPSNTVNVGFIARALPNARFIHLRRNPVDVGLSSLRTLFSHACPYSYDQAEYVAHYRNYRRLMDHWHAILPGRILDVAYDDLVQQPEATAAKIATFCGLEFEPQMVRIEKRSDAVSTASSVMMRDGIRRDRGRVWAAYETQLAPMIDALAGID